MSFRINLGTPLERPFIQSVCLGFGRADETRNRPPPVPAARLANVGHSWIIYEKM